MILSLSQSPSFWVMKLLRLTDARDEITLEATNWLKEGRDRGSVSGWYSYGAKDPQSVVNCGCYWWYLLEKDGPAVCRFLPLFLPDRCCS